MSLDNPEQCIHKALLVFTWRAVEGGITSYLPKEDSRPRKNNRHHPGRLHCLDTYIDSLYKPVSKGNA